MIADTVSMDGVLGFLILVAYLMGSFAWRMDNYDCTEPLLLAMIAITWLLFNVFIIGCCMPLTRRTQGQGRCSNHDCLGLPFHTCLTLLTIQL